MVGVTVLGSVELVSDERSAADHLANGEDSVGLDGVDADFLPVALGEELGPVRLVGDLGPDVAVCRGDRVERGGGSEAFGDVDLLGDVTGYREVVLDGFRVACDAVHEKRSNRLVEMMWKVWSVRYLRNGLARKERSNGGLRGMFTASSPERR